VKVVLGVVLAVAGCARWDDTCVPNASWTVSVRWSDDEALVNVQGQYAWGANSEGTSVIAIGPPLDPTMPSEVVIGGMKLATPALATIGADGSVLAARSVAPTVSGSAPTAVAIDPERAITTQWTSSSGHGACRLVHEGAASWEVSQDPGCGPIAAGPDGAVAYAVSGIAPTLNVMEPDGTARWTIALPADAVRVAFGDASDLVLQTAQALQTIDARTGSVIATLPGYGFATNTDGVLVARFETASSVTPVVSMYGFDGSERWTRRDRLPNWFQGLGPAGRVVLAGQIPDQVDASLHLRAGFDGVVVLDAATGDTLTATQTCPTFEFRAVTVAGVLAVTGGPDITAYAVPGLP